MQINDTAHLTLFSLIFMRMSGFIFLSPILGKRNVPNVVKGGIVFVLTLLVYSFSSDAVMDVDATSSLTLFIAYLKEFIVGIVLCFVTELFLFIVNFSGFFNDFQMGLSMATSYDPTSNSQMPISGMFFDIYMMLLFFAVDGHLVLMKIIVSSQEVVPYGTAVFGENLASSMLDIFCNCLELAVRFSMPIVIILFLVEIGIGLLMKIVPQINVFIVNIQLKMLVGFILLAVLFSPIGDFMKKIITEMFEAMNMVLHTF